MTSLTSLATRIVESPEGAVSPALMDRFVQQWRHEGTDTREPRRRRPRLPRILRRRRPLDHYIQLHRYEVWVDLGIGLGNRTVPPDAER